MSKIITDEIEHSAGSIKFRFNTTLKCAEIYNGFEWTQIGQATTDVDYLVVGGGGAGGGNWRGGGGGAGALRTSVGTQGGGQAAAPTLSLAKHTAYSVIIGAGGTGVVGTQGNSGGTTTFGTIVSKGGGGGGRYATVNDGTEDGLASADPGGGSGG